MHKKKEPKKIYVASSRRVMLVLMSLSTIYQYMYSSLFSSALGMLPVFGGAMFMSARMAGAFAHTFLSDRHKYLTRRTRVVFCVLTAITLLCSLALIALYPVLWTATPVWLTFAAVLSIALRSVAGRRLIGRRMRRTIGARAYWLLTALVHLVPLAAMAWILSANLDAATAWQLWGGFAAGGVLELYSQWRERDLLALMDHLQIAKAHLLGFSDGGNLALTFDRKIEKSLRKRYKLFCSLSTNVPDRDAWRDVDIRTTRNLPKNVAEEAQTAAQLEGVVSKETQLSVLSIVPDVKKELERMEQEGAEAAESTADFRFGADHEQ